MSAYPPANPSQPQRVIFEGVPEVQVKGVPTLLQMLLSLGGIAFIIIGSIVAADRFVMVKNLEAMEARMNERATKSESSLRDAIGRGVAPLTEEDARTRGVMRRLISASTIPPDEKKSLANTLDLGEVRAAVHKAPKNEVRRSLESLERDKKIEKREVTKFTWNDGKNEGQIRYFELLDPKLDLSRVDLYSEGDQDPCEARVLDLPGVDAVVEACEAHLDSKGKLEFIVIRNAE